MVVIRGYDSQQLIIQRFYLAVGLREEMGAVSLQSRVHFTIMGYSFYRNLHRVKVSRIEFLDGFTQFSVALTRKI